MDLGEKNLRNYFKENGIKTYSVSDKLDGILDKAASEIRQIEIDAAKASGNYKLAQEIAMKGLKNSIFILEERSNEDEFLIENREDKVVLEHIRQYYRAQNYIQTEDKQEIPKTEDNGRTVQNNGPLVFKSQTLEARVYPLRVKSGIILSITTS